MSTREELELLDQVQVDAELIAEEAEAFTGIDRREFMFMSLVTAAASTFGFGARALAPAEAGKRRTNSQWSEPVSWTFQPYPGGTGALDGEADRASAARPRSSARRSPSSRGPAPVPTSPEEIAFLPAHRLVGAAQGKKITSTQLTKIYLDRIKRLDPTLLCAVTIMEEQALAEAARADAEIKAGKYRGPLHGIPYGIKDLFSTKGVRTTWGSKDFENRVIDEDAEMVVRLARRRRGVDGEARDGPVRAGRPVVSRPHEQSVGHSARIERIVGRARRRRRRPAASRSASARRRRARSCRRRASAD